MTHTTTATIASALSEEKKPSAREVLQARLVCFLAKDSERWTAPYGIVPGIEPLPKGGAARSVYFGVRDVMQARIAIFSPRDIRVTTTRDDGSTAERVFADEAAVCAWIDQVRAALDRR